MLGRLIHQRQKRLLGVSDGFDSDLPHYKWMLHLFALIHEYFIDQLREKVIRGGDDAFRMDASTGGTPPLGYKLVDMIDENGGRILGRDKVPRRTRAIDKPDDAFVLKAFEWYVNRGRTPDRIAQVFNRLKVGGRTNWNDLPHSRAVSRAAVRSYTVLVEDIRPQVDIGDRD